FRSVEHFDFGPVSILLLERLGNCVPISNRHIRKRRTVPASIRDDLKEILSHISELGIYYRYRSEDIEPKHVLSANTPISSGDAPTLPWRLVDFAFSKKKNHDVHDIQPVHNEQVRLFGVHYAMPVKATLGT
ncbi:hypothetical protein ABKN59_012018, partial [Abortiporus biennis]